MSLQQEVEDIAKEMPSDVGVFVEKLGNEIGVELNADKKFATASTFKLPVMVAAMREADDGRLDLQTEVEIAPKDVLPSSQGLSASASVTKYQLLDLITQMIVFSDNGSTDLVMRFVPATTVMKHLADIGLSETHVGWTVSDIFTAARGFQPPTDVSQQGKPDPLMLVRLVATGTTGNADIDKVILGQSDPGSPVHSTEPPNNYTTPKDMALLLQAIWQKDAASEASCERMLQIMAMTMTPSRIRPGIPDAQPVAHKTGTLPGARNDVGLLPLLDGSALIICLYTTHVTDSVAVDHGLYSISRAAYAWAMKRAGYEAPKSPY